MKSRALGFTLLEVLAALVIVSLGMLGVIEAVSQTASNGAYLRDKSIAHWIAMNQLTTVRLAQQPPKIDKTSDEIEMADRQWRWTMEVSQTPLDSVRRIDITVRLEDADEDSSLAAVTGFYGTAIAQPGTTIVAWQGENLPPNGGPGDEDQDQDEDDGDKQPPTTPPPEEQPDPEPIDTPPDPPPETE
ncbi:MAG TPA: type II secretion system minor pseudopilin GspI [Povalibacter sp.]